MKKVFTIALACGALSLTACETRQADAHYGYETQAPYSDTRTVGNQPQPQPQPAERVFYERQRK